jgi:8-oxo-dGTP diphosphatase
LQRVFEILLARKLEKKAFRTRMLASDLLIALDTLKETSRRPAQLYRGKERTGITYFARAFEPAKDN